MLHLRRWLLPLALAGALTAVGHAPAASAAAPTFFVGADEDALLWGSSSQTATVARSLGLKAVRITLQWKPGQTQVPASYQQQLNRLVLDSWSLRVVATVYGLAQDRKSTRLNSSH